MLHNFHSVHNSVGIPSLCAPLPSLNMANALLDLMSSTACYDPEWEWPQNSKIFRTKNWSFFSKEAARSPQSLSERRSGFVGNFLKKEGYGKESGHQNVRQASVPWLMSRSGAMCQRSLKSMRKRP